MSKEKFVIDAKNGVLGRVASFAAKQALQGKEVVIVNCNDTHIIGDKSNIVKEYQITRKRGGSSMNGPFFPKSPERLMKRTIRGMLDYTRGRGEAALHRIICYNRTPAEFEQSKKFSFTKPILAKSMTLYELEKVI